MWEGVVRKCDVCCNYPRNPLKEGWKKKPGWGRAWPGIQRPDPHCSQFITSYPSSVSLSTMGFFKTVVHSWCYFYTFSPIIVTQIDLPAVASSLCMVLKMNPALYKRWNTWKMPTNLYSSTWVLLLNRHLRHMGLCFSMKKVDGGDELNIYIEQMIRAHF